MPNNPWSDPKNRGERSSRQAPAANFNTAPAQVPSGRAIAADWEPLAPHEVKHLQGINPTKTVRGVDQLFVGEAPRGGLFVVMETDGKLFVYRVASSERRRLGRQFRGPWLPALRSELSATLRAWWHALTYRGEP